MEYQPRPRIVDLPDALADPTTSEGQRAAYRRAHDRIVRWIDARGAARDGLVISGN
jgi:poly-gamma-glutamate synthesis protein (capsule biosynthesis protein)